MRYGTNRFAWELSGAIQDAIKNGDFTTQAQRMKAQKTIEEFYKKWTSSELEKQIEESLLNKEEDSMIPTIQARLQDEYIWTDVMEFWKKTFGEQYVREYRNGFGLSFHEGKQAHIRYRLMLENKFSSSDFREYVVHGCDYKTIQFWVNNGTAWENSPKALYFKNRIRRSKPLLNCFSSPQDIEKESIYDIVKNDILSGIDVYDMYRMNQTECKEYAQNYINSILFETETEKPDNAIIQAVDFLTESIKRYIRETIQIKYSEAVELLENAHTSQDFLHASNLFKELENYKDSKDKTIECNNKADLALVREEKQLKDEREKEVKKNLEQKKVTHRNTILGLVFALLVIALVFGMMIASEDTEKGQGNENLEEYNIYIRSSNNVLADEQHHQLNYL